jgi:hypothetical protein
MHTKLVPAIAAGAAAILMMSSAALAEERTFTASLLPSEEVPPVMSDGRGDLEAILDIDTKLFRWTVTFENLSGAPTAAHFHGPADPGENAGPVVPVSDLESPMEGEITLDDEQIADLMAGKWYFNIHTAEHPGGEIRGQVMRLED